MQDNVGNTSNGKIELTKLDTEHNLIDGAISGMVEALGDAYTEYIPKDKMEDYKQNLMGNYVGIGIYMAKNTENNTNKTK